MVVTKSAHRKAFEEFSDRLRNELKESIDKIILFGSVVRQEEGEKSDVDVLIVVNGDKIELKEEIISIAYEITLQSEIYISPKVLLRQEYDRLMAAKTSFLKNIEEEGKIIYDRGER